MKLHTLDFPLPRGPITRSELLSPNSTHCFITACSSLKRKHIYNKGYYDYSFKIVSLLVIYQTVEKKDDTFLPDTFMNNNKIWH